MGRNGIWSIFFIATIIFGCIMVENVGFAKASTPINGLIKTDTTWTKANSPYELTGPVGVASGVTLTIEPGTTINLINNFFEVNGTLIARGTATDPITFYGGFLCVSTQGSIVEHAIVTKVFCDDFAKITDSKISDLETSGGSPLVENNVLGSVLISDDSTAIFSGNTFEHGLAADLFWDSNPVLKNNRIYGQISCYGNGGSLTIVNNTVSNVNSPAIRVSRIHADIIGNYISGDVTVEKGGQIIGDTRASATISNNVFSGGIRLYGSGSIENNLIKDVSGTAIIAANDALINNNTITNCDVCIAFSGDVVGTPSVLFNNFIGYKTNSLKWGSGTDGDVKNNWWGTTDTSVISQSIYDNKNNYNLGTVNFTPFLTQTNPQAIPYIDPTMPSSTPEVNQSPIPTGTQSQTQTDEHYLEVTLLATFIASIFVAGLVFFVRKSKAKVDVERYA